jgi:hypothetical protein
MDDAPTDAAGQSDERAQTRRLIGRVHDLIPCGRGYRAELTLYGELKKWQAYHDTAGFWKGNKYIGPRV